MAVVKRHVTDLFRTGIDLSQFLRGVLLLALALVFSTTTTDPDLWGHVRFGLDMLQSRSIPLQDPYSFTSDRVWINHEWLAEALFGIAYAILGPLGLNLLRVGTIAAVLMLVWRRLSAAASARLRVPVLALAAVGIFLRVYPIRPQLSRCCCSPSFSSS